MDHTHPGGHIRESGIKKGFLIAFIMVVGIGAVNFGYSIGVFNSMQLDYLFVFEINPEKADTWISLMTTLSSIGAAIGSLTTGPLTRFGKKNCIHGANVLVVIGCTLTLIKVKEVVLAGRFIFGLAAGSFTVFVPSFINELTPTELKGPFGSATQLLITFGILVANLLGIPFPDAQHHYEPGFVGDQYWRMLFAVPIAFAVVQSALLFTIFNYETPKYLKINGKKAEL